MKFTPKEEKAIKDRYQKLIDDFFKKVPARIKAMREGADKNNKGYKGSVNQTHMAQLMGMISQNYNKMEYGKNNKWGIGVSTEHLIKFCVIFNCSADYLLFGKEVEDTQDQTGLINELKASLDSERKLNAILEEKLKRKK